MDISEHIEALFRRENYHVLVVDSPTFPLFPGLDERLYCQEGYDAGAENGVNLSDLPHPSELKDQRHYLQAHALFEEVYDSLRPMLTSQPQPHFVFINYGQLHQGQLYITAAQKYYQSCLMPPRATMHFGFEDYSSLVRSIELARANVVLLQGILDVRSRSSPTEKEAIVESVAPIHRVFYEATLSRPTRQHLPKLATLLVTHARQDVDNIFDTSTQHYRDACFILEEVEGILSAPKREEFPYANSFTHF